MRTIRTLAATTLGLAALALSGTAQAEDGCTVVDFQGAPATICPPVERDLTNCYTGWYQGAPIEICLPTGDQLPEGSTFNGAPVVYHVSVDYVAPASTVASAPTPPSAVADDVAVDTPATPPNNPVWLDQLLVLIEANGGSF